MTRPILPQRIALMAQAKHNLWSASINRLWALCTFTCVCAFVRCVRSVFETKMSFDYLLGFAGFYLQLIMRSCDGFVTFPNARRSLLNRRLCVRVFENLIYFRDGGIVSRSIFTLLMWRFVVIVLSFRIVCRFRKHSYFIRCVLHMRKNHFDANNSGN